MQKEEAEKFEKDMAEQREMQAKLQKFIEDFEAQQRIKAARDAVRDGELDKFAAKIAEVAKDEEAELKEVERLTKENKVAEAKNAQRRKELDRIVETLNQHQTTVDKIHGGILPAALDIVRVRLSERSLPVQRSVYRSAARFSVGVVAGGKWEGPRKLVVGRFDIGHGAKHRNLLMRSRICMHRLR